MKCNTNIILLNISKSQFIVKNCDQLPAGIGQGCPTFFQFGPYSISFQGRWAGGPQKLFTQECSDFLLSVPKFRCSLKKRSSSIFLLKFFTFGPKIQIFSKKNSLLLESPLIYQFPPQMSLSNLAELFFVIFIITRKLEIVVEPHQNSKWAAGWTSLV